MNDTFVIHQLKEDILQIIPKRFKYYRQIVVKHKFSISELKTILYLLKNKSSLGTNENLDDKLTQQIFPNIFKQHV